jgi:outer membrane PBP1 activator LpoA protein
MTLRFIPMLLLGASLVFIHSCSTSVSRPAPDIPTDIDQPARTEDGDIEGKSYDPQLTPSDRSLTEVIELAGSVSEHTPDMALEIIRSLESIPSGQLTEMIDRQSYDAEFTEWLELSLQVRQAMVNGDLDTAARNWANYHFGHSINRTGFAELVSGYAAFFPAPTQVAVLLPAEGGLASASLAIRDGILSAYLEQPGTTVIRFYSSGKNSESAISAYLQARADGATQVIGPLRISSTRALATLEEVDIPVLLLNEGPADMAKPESPRYVSSLSLSQSKEAEMIAVSTLSLEQKRAIVLAPDNSWGTRIERAFTRAFEEGGGQIAAAARFVPDLNDHSYMLTEILKINESKKRKDDLQSRLGINLSFEPVRRDDFDFVFMAASPAEGRELRPLLKFHNAGDVPVYAMSRVYSGKVEPGSDQDLNELIFPTTRWQLQVAGQTMPKLESLRGGAYGNLYALGRDAWYLLPWLPLMQKDPDLEFSGNIGSLRLQANGTLLRDPAWAQFTGGQPVPYQWPAVD